METVVNGRSVNHYKDFKLLETGLAVPKTEDLYIPAVGNGLPPDDWIVDDELVLYHAPYADKGLKFLSADRYRPLCSVTGALWRPNHRYYDGVDDNIALGTDASLAVTTGDFTILAWIKLTEIGAHRVFIGGSSLNAPHIFSRNNEAFLLSKPGAANAPPATTAVIVDTWQFRGVSFDNSEAVNNCQYTIDGVDDGLVSFDQDFADKISHIGIGNNAGSWPWKGNIGELWFYRGIKTIAEQKHTFETTRWRYQS